MALTLSLLPQILSIARLAPLEPIPEAVWQQPFLSITRTPEELSLVSGAEALEDCEIIETGWRALQVEGPLDFALTGILASLTAPLATAQITLFALSTYDTDYILIRQTSVEAAIRVLSAAGYTVIAPLDAP